ncbi:MAG TPA: hypothetical protein VFG99_00355 [Chloroflexia bacterium]|nr:hypothetical protein [Chloroflexia bacterium]
MADIYFDPVMWAARKLSRAPKKQPDPGVKVEEPAALVEQPVAAPRLGLRDQTGPLVVKDGIIFDPAHPNRARAVPRGGRSEGQMARVEGDGSSPTPGEKSSN